MILLMLLRAIIFYEHGQEILYPPGFDKYHALVPGKIFTCLDSVVYSVAEQGADVQRLNEVYAVKINGGGKVDMLFTGFLCLILNDNVKKVIACMNIIFVSRNL